MLVGIDLGTTHSLVAHYTATGPQLLVNAQGETLTPSCVSVDDHGQVLVGRAARDRLVTHPEHTAAAFKRHMGSGRELLLGRRRFRPEELSALVLRSLLADATQALGQAPDEAIISVPAYFSDAQRQATRVAGELAGIRVQRLVNEPTAAALAYGLEQRADGATFMVLDLGGGTFDVSILELFDGVMQVHASAGDNFLGGEDFLEVLVEHTLAELGLVRDRLDRSALAQLYSRLERAKQALTHQAQLSLELELGGRQHTLTLEEPRFEQQCQSLLKRLRAPIERALRDARLQPGDLSEVILVGGASRMPMVSRLVARLFGRLPLRHVHPDHAIALGTAVAAGLKERRAELAEVVMTDVCPYTLGVDTARMDEQGRHHAGYFSPIIPRNTAVPVSRAETYSPVHDGQRELALGIYQGESPRVAHNIRLGELTLKLEPRPAHENATEVRFTYDINGLLQVEATVLRTGARAELVLQRSEQTLDPADIAQRLQALAALKVHPRDQQANLAWMARAERLYAEYLDHREPLQAMIDQFQRALDSQDLARIDTLRRDLEAVLDRIES